MKLVDILAQELKVWPEGDSPLVQGSFGQVYICGGGPIIIETCRADDWELGEVTRAEWQAAVDALNAPKVVEWDGEDMPPVGSASCEYLGAHKYDEWTVVNIFAHYGHTVFVDFGDGWRAEDDSSRFRPIRTAEQVAAEERKSEILEMIDTFGTDTAIWGRDAVMEICGHLWESGYRKEPKPCGS